MLTAISRNTLNNQNEAENKQKNISPPPAVIPEDKTGLKAINLLDYAKTSPFFYSIMEPMQREQSARIIQRAWRARKSYVSSGSPSRKTKYTETLTGPLSLRFIKMPTDDKHKEHARKIKNGNWVSLDFSDPQALRNFYLACAKKYITTNQLVTAIMLHAAKDLFGSIPKHT